MMLRNGAFAVAFVVSCGSGEGTVATTSSTSALSASATEAPVPPAASDASALDSGFVERARAVAASCTWRDESGFEDCKGVEALLAAKVAPPQAFAAAELLLADKTPAVRRVGLDLMTRTMAPSPRPQPPVSTALALINAAEIEQTPALDMRLAMAAASLDSKRDELRAPLETLVRTGSIERRATALRFLSKGTADPPWVPALIAEALTDKDAKIRVAAVEGLFGRFVSHRAETCAQLVTALADPDVSVRDAARSALIGNIDVMLEDPKRGLIGGRVAPFAKPCDEPEVEAAYKSLAKDMRDKQLSPEADALFHNGVLLRGPWNSPEPTTPAQEKRRELAVKELTTIAKDKKAPQSARLTAIRGLRLKVAGDNRKLFDALAKDGDELVAKAATAPLQR